MAQDEFFKTPTQGAPETLEKQKMKIKSSELTDATLDWAVAKCIVGEEMSRLRVRNGRVDLLKDGGEPSAYRLPTNFSTDWAQGGPIIEREMIDIEYLHSTNQWHSTHPKNRGGLIRHHGYGPTPLIAAMRCYCFAKLGDIVDVPDELLKSV